MNLSSEMRSVDLVDAEVRNGREFRGYAAVFDSPWNDKLTAATGYIEKVARGVFRKALAKGDDVPLLIAHDRHQLLGTTGAGNVRLREDGKGLLVEAKLPDNYLGEYARSMIDAGDLKGMSYGYELDPRRDTLLTRSVEGIFTRTIAAVENLLDVSLTYEPAYTATTVELRSANFVALPLQEILSGAGSQTEEAVTETTPDDPGVRSEEPSDPNPKPSRRFWEVVITDLEGDGYEFEGGLGVHAPRRNSGATRAEGTFDSGTANQGGGLGSTESRQ